MKTQSIINRNNSFLSIIDKISQKQKLIFELIKENKSCTAWQISNKYMLPINEVTGRITELKNACLIIENGSSQNRYTKKMNTAYRITSNDERINLINRKFIHLRDKKDQLINDFNRGLSEFSKEIIQKELIKIKNKINRLEKLEIC